MNDNEIISMGCDISYGIHTGKRRISWLIYPSVFIENILYNGGKLTPSHINTYNNKSVFFNDNDSDIYDVTLQVLREYNGI